MSSTKTERARRQQLLREAEGYLELLVTFEDRWPLALHTKRPIAERALDLLHRAGREESQLARVLFLEGFALRILERYEDAVVPLELSADLDPENTATWMMLGWCYKRCDRLDAAIEAMESGLEYDPGEALLYYNLACYASLARDKSTALQSLARALAIEPDMRSLVDTESDFDPIRRDPSFIRLLRTSS